MHMHIHMFYVLTVLFSLTRSQSHQHCTALEVSLKYINKTHNIAHNINSNVHRHLILLFLFLNLVVKSIFVVHNEKLWTNGC